ncbi:MAG: hypothetical protein WCJ92_08195 [Alphaproteobacteria bacterium]
MKNIQKKAFTTLSPFTTKKRISAFYSCCFSIIAMCLEINASAVRLEVLKGTGTMSSVLSGRVQKVGGGTMSLASPNPSLVSLDIHGGTVSVAGTANLGASTAVSLSGSGCALQGAGSLAVRSLALSAAGAVTNSGATTIASATLAGNVLTTNSVGGTTITSLVPDATGSIANADALTLVGATAVAQPINVSGAGATSIAGPLNSTGGFVSSASAVSLGAAGQLPTGTNAFSGGSLSLAASGAAAAIRSATNFTGSAQFNIPASATPGSITGAVNFASGTAAVLGGTSDAGILGTGGSYTFQPGSTISVPDGATWSAPVTILTAS